MLNFHNTTQ